MELTGTSGMTGIKAPNLKVVKHRRDRAVDVTSIAHQPAARLDPLRHICSGDYAECGTPEVRNTGASMTFTQVVSLSIALAAGGYLAESMVPKVRYLT